MSILYLNDVEPCFCCSKPTKRVNTELELPSCSLSCDVKLFEEPIDETGN